MSPLSHAFCLLVYGRKRWTTPSRMNLLSHETVRTSAIAGLLAGIAVGCGATHGPSEQQQVSQVLRSYLHAQVEGDGTAACALLTPGGQRELVNLVVRSANGLIPVRPSCPEAVVLVRAVAGASLLSALGSARIERVPVTGSRADAVVADGTRFPPQHVVLEKVGGSWKIASVPGLGG